MTHVAVVLAAGQGTRMKSGLPKVLHPVAGQPMLRWVLDAVRGTEPERTVVVVGHGADRVRDVLDEDGSAVVQPEQLGTGHATSIAIETLAGEPDDRRVLVVPGDTPLVTAEVLRQLLDLHEVSVAAVGMLTTEVPDPTGYGRVMRADDGTVVSIVEEKDAGDHQRRVREINAGMYVFTLGELRSRLGRLTNNNRQGEYYLTDVVGMAAGEGARVVASRAEPEAVSGVNDHEQLARAAAVLRGRINRSWMAVGVRMVDPARVYIDPSVTLASDVVLYPGVHLEGHTAVGEGAVVGPDVYCSDSTLGSGSHVWYSVVRGAEIGADVEVGPFASLRPGARLERGAKAGTFVEMKNTRVGEGAKVPHLSYMGDADIGAGANVGAGSITCNYDGFEKHRTIIGAGAFIGSDTMLVAPVSIGDGAITAAGSAITGDVEAGALGVARGRQRNVPGYAARREARYRARRSEES